MLRLKAACLLLMAVAATAAAQSERGSISGSIGFPSEEIPALRVYAIAVDGKTHHTTTTDRKQSRFVIKEVPPGHYYVVAYPASHRETPLEAGGWTRFVQCGMNANCKDHALVPVAVTAGQAATGINVADWYAQAGAFPLEPAQKSRPSAGSTDCASRGSQLEEDACNLKAYEAADKILNREFQRLTVDLSKAPTCRNQLRDAQRAWIRFRDEHCRYEGGTGPKGRTTQCLRELTELRADYLKRQAPDLCNP